jgi:hypothetical protein
MKAPLIVVAALVAGCSSTPAPLEVTTWAQRGEPWAACQVALRQQLRDPDSYQDDLPGTTPPPRVDAAARTVTYRWQFRAKNGFGGYAAGTAECTNTLPEGSTDPFGQASARVVQ